MGNLVKALQWHMNGRMDELLTVTGLTGGSRLFPSYV